MGEKEERVKGRSEVQAGNWVEEEFRGIELGDRRLEKRFYKMGEQLSARPEAYINQACEDWKDAKAAYRFFDNERVTEEKILSAHRQRVLERMRSHKVVLAVQDTTELDYTPHGKATGLGPIGNHKAGAHGLRVHTTLGVTVEGVPLGIIYQEIEARVDKLRGLTLNQKKQQIKKTAIWEKESMRWIRSLERTIEYSSSLDEGKKERSPLVVTVADRESDIFDLLVVAQHKKAAYLVRANQDRLVLDEEQRQLWGVLEAAEAAGCYTVTVQNKKKGASKGAATRQAKLEVRYVEDLVLKPTRRKPEFRVEGWGPVRLNAIYVKEVEATIDVEDQIEWMLLTNLPVRSFEEVLEKVEWYCQRWHIETYHKVLKSGCRVEQCQLATGERLGRYVALMSVVAWRLFWMTYWQRVADVSTSCKVVLAPHEWKALYCKTHRTSSAPQEEEAPTLREAVRWIARLGGFLGRKGDGEPGVTVLWRGWCRLTDIADMWLITHPDESCG